MADADGVFIFIGTYPDEAAARADYDVVKDSTSSEPSAPTTPRSSRRMRRARHTSTRTRWRPGTGPGRGGAGALVGILFPPAVIGSAVVGAAVGGVSGHLWRGMSRSEVKEFGEIIYVGQAALVVVGESTLQDAIDKAELKAEKRVAKQVDVSSKDIDAAVQEAAKDVG